MPPPPPMQASSEAPHLRSVQQLSGESLFLLAAQPGGHLAASRERLRREVMQVDGVSYAESLVTVREIAHTSAENVWLGLLPYRSGIAVAVVGGWVSLPLVFSLTVAKWFNDIAVTTDVPSVSDLETLLEVRAACLNSRREGGGLAVTVRARRAGGLVDVELDGAAARHDLFLPPLHAVRS